MTVNDEQQIDDAQRCPRSLCKGCRWCYIFRLLLVPVVIGAMVVVLLSAACFTFNDRTSRV